MTNNDHKWAQQAINRVKRNPDIRKYATTLLTYPLGSTWHWQMVTVLNADELIDWAKCQMVKRGVLPYG